MTGARPEEAEDSNEFRDAAASLVAALPGALTPGQRHRLAAAVADRLASGWTAAALTAELTVDLAGVRSFDALYRHRLATLPAEAPAGPPAVQRDLPPLLGPAHAFEPDPADPDSCLRCPRPRENRIHQAASDGRCGPETPPPPPRYGYVRFGNGETRTGVHVAAMPAAVAAAIGAAADTSGEADAHAA